MPVRRKGFVFSICKVLCRLPTGMKFSHRGLFTLFFVNPGKRKHPHKWLRT